MARPLLLLLLLSVHQAAGDCQASCRKANDLFDDAIEDLKSLCTFPTVSADSGRAKDVKAAGHWLADRLKSIGLEQTRVIPPVSGGNHPYVYGEWRRAQHRPTVLIYGHYDVQPEGESARWETEPFSPTIRGDRIVARGASDDKGGVIGVVHALRSVKEASGGFPVNVKVLFEGEEEIGSPGLRELLRSNSDLLAADVALSADGIMPSPDEPAVVLGYRGSVAMEIAVQGPSSDLHSGLYGGSVMNPNVALSRILSSLHNKNGTVAVPGFYDDVESLPSHLAQTIRSHEPDPDREASLLGVNKLYGEPGFSTIERRSTRPTLEIVSVHSGSNSLSTIVPSKAVAKIVCRTVPNQTPEKTYNLVAEHVSSVAPTEVSVSVERHPFTALPYRALDGSFGLAAVKEALREVTEGHEPPIAFFGGSVPALAYFQKELSIDAHTLAFSSAGDKIHAPNEEFSLTAFNRTIHAFVIALHRLGIPSHDDEL